MNMNDISRRDFFKTTGALVISIALPGSIDSALSQPASGKPPLLPDELDSWIAILPNGNATAYFGKMDMGQGVDVAVQQMVAEELDLAFERVNVVMGDTALTCNQGGARAAPACNAAAWHCAMPPPKRGACWSSARRKSSVCPRRNSR